jgi:hypothetical protein
MRAVAARGGCFPSEAQALLLRAALLPGEAAREAFHRWRGLVDPMALEEASFRLLPHLARNLLRLGEPDPELDRWKGTYRRAFAFNATLFRDAAAALRALEDAGIAALVLDGAAIVAGVSGESGLRPMGGVGVLVPPGEAGRAFATLGALGWRGLARFSERLLRSRRGAAFVDPGGRRIDLQWYLLRENCYPGADDPVWKAARIGHLGPFAARAPCAADQLLQVCIDGLQRGEGPRAPWAADAFVLCASGEVEWGRLCAEAARRRLALPLRTALRWIRDELAAPVPGVALARLEGLRVSAAERRELSAKLEPPRDAARLRVLWSHHARAAAGMGRGRAATLLRFVLYLRDALDLERVAELPAFILRRGLRRMWETSRSAGRGAVPRADPRAARRRGIESRNPE